MLVCVANEDLLVSQHIFPIKNSFLYVSMQNTQYSQIVGQSWKCSFSLCSLHNVVNSARLSFGLIDRGGLRLTSAAGRLVVTSIGFIFVWLLRITAFKRLSWSSFKFTSLNFATLYSGLRRVSILVLHRDNSILNAHIVLRHTSFLPSLNVVSVFNQRTCQCVGSLQFIPHRNIFILYHQEYITAVTKVILHHPSYVMVCAIWYHLYNLKNLKNTHGGVIPLVKLQAKACNYSKSNTLPCVFFTFLK